MTSSLRGLLVVAAVAVMAMATPSKADVIVGQPADSGAGNCIPFGCTIAWTPEYQQIYAASQFSGPITITNLEFFNTQFQNTGASPNTGTFTISLSTTSAAVNGLDPTLAHNIGPDNTVVFEGSLPSLSGGVMSLILSTPFTYDPTQGNLLMDVFSADAAQPFADFFFDTNSDSNGVFSRAWPGTQDPNDGLVTGFSTGAVPEPSTWAMMLAGFAGLGFLGYRRTVKARLAA